MDLSREQTGPPWWAKGGEFGCSGQNRLDRGGEEKKAAGFRRGMRRPGWERADPKGTGKNNGVWQQPGQVWGTGRVRGPSFAAFNLGKL